MSIAALRLRTAAVAGLMLTGGATVEPPRAAAEVERYRHGYWRPAEAITPGGSRLCAVSTNGPSIETDYRLYLGIKYYTNLDIWVVHLANTAWSLRPGVRVQVQIQFGDAAPVLTEAAVAMPDAGGQLIELTVERSRVATLLTQFAAAGHGVIRFSGTEEPWTMRMNGSSAALIEMVQCIKRARNGAEIPYPWYKQPPVPPMKPPAAKPQPRADEGEDI